MPTPLSTTVQPTREGAELDRALDELCINTVRTLAIDAVQQANSGHPGAPMALAPVAYTLWQKFLRYDPDDPIWPNRDRFVLSNGHASMLLYALLHLSGVKSVSAEYEILGAPAVTLDDIKRFRQLGSKCPGHPEYHLTSGVETTTGPLGQGCGASVGMALAGRWLARHFNRPDFSMFDYDIYAVCGDGDMMEGVSSEAASLAGHQMLGNLCWIYDSNRVTIEGHTDLAFSDDVAARFLAYGWNVCRVGDANDAERLAQAIQVFRRATDAPTLIIVESHIGYGAPHKHDTSAAHGEPLGEEEVRLVKRSYGWPEDAKFLVPEGVREHFHRGIGRRGRKLREEWSHSFRAYRKKFPDLADQIERMQNRELPEGWDADLPVFDADPKGIASRDSSGRLLNAIAWRYPWLIGGSADLAPSTKTRLTFEGAGDLEADDPGARNLHFGVREHAMGAVLNGIALSKLRAYGSGFLIFSDYMKPPIRLAALMELPVIYIFTHDSIGVGEDGPTHQPVEQLIALRAIPGLVTIRPADANEVVEAWRVIVQLRRQPACLVLSRQSLPTIDRTHYAPAAGLRRGAYVLADAPDGKPEVILIGTGSEVALCIDAYEELSRNGVHARVVSMPSWELFEQQDRAYRDEVLPPDVTARVSVEMGSVVGWDRYVGATGAKVGMNTFGSSAPLKDVLTRFGFTPEKVLVAAKNQLSGSKSAREKAGVRTVDAIDGQVANLPGDLERLVADAIETYRREDGVARLWNGDASLWTGSGEDKWLGWLGVVAEQRRRLADLSDLANDIQGQNFSHVLLLGMGGSSLGAEVFAMTFGLREKWPELLVLDSTDPAQIRTIENRIDPARTLFVVSSKSGTTLEPNILKRYFFAQAQKAVGADKAGSRFIAITDPGANLQAIAEHDRFRHIAFGLPDIGGRYSVLSDFGLAPAVAMGVDARPLLDAAHLMVRACAPDAAPHENPGLVLGAILGVLAEAGRDKVTIVASPGIADFGAWLEQLLAESTGKRGKGIVPVDAEPLGPPGVYGADRLFVYLRLSGEADDDQDKAIDALEQAGHPVVRVAVADRYRIGQEFFRWEFATAVAGAILGINPFDQPDVEASKQKTRELTAAYEQSGALPPEAPLWRDGALALFTDRKSEPLFTNAGTLADHLAVHFDRIRPGDYCALLAYIERNGRHRDALQDIRVMIRDRKRVASCLGFGPRFLHSTGQVYKGGPNTGVFLQITGEAPDDLRVPDQKYTFGVVEAAQARGDFEVLAERGRRLLRIHLGPDVAAGLTALKSAVRQALG